MNGEVNGQSVFRDHPVPHTARAPHYYLGVGSRLNTIGAEARWSGLRVRAVKPGGVE